MTSPVLKIILSNKTLDLSDKEDVLIDDLQRIQYTLHEIGYDLTLRECELIWRTYSADYGMGFMSINFGDNELERILTEITN